MEEQGQFKRALIDAAAGAISGAVSRTVTSPLDVIKIRFQVAFSIHLRFSFLFFSFPLLIVDNISLLLRVLFLQENIFNIGGLLERYDHLGHDF